MNFFTLFLFIVAFSTIIILIANKKNFGVAMLIGSLILSISIPDRIYGIFISTITNFTVIALMIIVVLIKLLATILEKGGLIDALIKKLEAVLTTRGILIAIPSILGLLPVPGGALLSAPVVKEQGDKVGMKKEEEMAINLWYRHIGFMIYPLSTSLILLSGLSGINIYTLILFQIPVFFIAFFVGMIFVYKYKGGRSNVRDGNLRALIPILLPVAIAIPLSFFLAFFISKEQATYSSYLVAIPLAILSAAILSNKKIEWKEGISLTLALAIFGIMFFKNIIYATGLTKEIPSYFSFLPPILLIPLISFIIGILTAHNMAAIGILYPMFSSIMDLNLIIVMFISSFFGYLVSPLHLCIVVTYDYFHPKFGEFYKKIIPPSIAVMIIVAILYGIIL